MSVPPDEVRLDDDVAIFECIQAESVTVLLPFGDRVVVHILLGVLHHDRPKLFKLALLVHLLVGENLLLAILTNLLQVLKATGAAGVALAVERVALPACEAAMAARTGHDAMALSAPIHLLLTAGVVPPCFRTFRSCASRVPWMASSAFWNAISHKASSVAAGYAEDFLPTFPFLPCL